MKAAAGAFLVSFGTRKTVGGSRGPPSRSETQALRLCKATPNLSASAAITSVKLIGFFGNLTSLVGQVSNLEWCLIGAHPICCDLRQLSQFSTAPDCQGTHPLVSSQSSRFYARAPIQIANLALASSA